MSFPANEWIVLCPGKCKKWICRYCGKPPHYNEKCAQWKAQDDAKKAVKGKPDFQWCKKCGLGNERVEACNHVVCSGAGCGFNMCILCGGEWSDKLGIANGYCYSYKCKVYGKDRKDWN